MNDVDMMIEHTVNIINYIFDSEVVFVNIARVAIQFVHKTIINAAKFTNSVSGDDDRILPKRFPVCLC